MPASGKLFVVMLGGTHPKARIELHDVAFAIGDTLQSTYAQLRAQWFADPQGTHVDSWMIVHGVENRRVELRAEPAPADAPKLFFVNLGGYDKARFGESHEYVLVVAGDAAEAKKKAVAQADAVWWMPHKDALYEVDACLPVDAVGGRHVHLILGEHAGIEHGSDYLVIS